ncbi:hypothetical protein ACNKHR_22535 [Shigella flexneri]
MQYYLLKASNELAKSKARARGLAKPLTRKGSCRFDTYMRSGYHRYEPLHYDWEALRESIKTHGLRNSTLFLL